MGAKAPSKLKLRRPTFKCDACSRKFLSAQALKTHQYCMHKIDETAGKISKQTKGKGKLTTLLGKEVKKPELTKLKDVAVSKTPVRKKSINLGEKPAESPSVSDVRKIEFECPQCFKMFSVYFSAYRHIQKFHCINTKGQKVHPNAPDLIKPVRVELCLKCNMRVRPTEAHCCDTAAYESSVLVSDYSCLACKQKFSSMQMFDVHVSGIHSKEIDSMFFPEMSQFQSWKEHMEKVSNSKYSLFGKWNSKKSYRCSFDPNIDKTEESDNVSYFCPSSIILTEYTKGVQVHFYKEHYGHTCKEYKLADTYKKFSITSFMTGCSANESIEGVDKEVDLYARFKRLMDCIIVDTEKVSIPCLKLLISKALEMSTIIKLYLDEGEYVPNTNVDNRSMTDDEITKALETFIQSRVKRRSIDSLRSNNDSDTPVILNTFSMAEEEPTKKKPKLIKESPIKKIQSPSSVSSFNDSYKDFVDKNFKVSVDEIKPETKRRSHIRSVKIGPISNDIKNDNKPDATKNDVNTITETRSAKKTVKIDPVKDIKNDHKPDAIKNDINTPSETRSAKKTVKIDAVKDIKNDNKADATKNDINTMSETRSAKKTVKIKIDKDVTMEASESVKKVKTEKKKDAKKVMKTKIGQFKPSLSPKNLVKEESRRSIDLGRLKVDFEYEVKEQENDCNILILKI